MGQRAWYWNFIVGVETPQVFNKLNCFQIIQGEKW
jgi:hypothetical protein